MRRAAQGMHFSHSDQELCSKNRKHENGILRKKETEGSYECLKSRSQFYCCVYYREPTRATGLRKV